MRTIWLAVVAAGCDAAVTECTVVGAPDADGDGIADLVEIELGLDPFHADSDGDLWRDDEEVDAGTPATNRYIHPFGWGGYPVGTAASPRADCTGPTGEAAWADEPWAVYQPGDVACNFRLGDSYGQPVDLYAFEGRFVLINVCTMWCSACRTNELTELAERYADDVTVMTVITDDWHGDAPDNGDLAQWRDDLELYRIPVLTGPAEVWEAYSGGGSAIAYVLLDRELRVLANDDTALHLDRWLD